tara:strand:+ start:223 stop:546 length:324 start_codon:yes stop_codon:yes gene_type:complete
MKIYTEINYEFKDGELIEIDSKFFNYTGELLLCNGGGGPPPPPPPPPPPEPEGSGENELDEDDPGYVAGKGFAQRVEGYDPYLQAQTRTQGVQGQFSRKSLRVERPS